MSQDLSTCPLAAPPRSRTSDSTDGWSTRIARRLLERSLGNLRHGQLTLVEGDRVRHFGQPSDRAGLSARINVLDPRFPAAVLTGGSLAAGATYLRGWWECDDLTTLIRLFCRNRTALGTLDAGWTQLLKPLRWLAHRARRNTLAGSRRNIAAHYDLGNDFYALWLDDSMTYSAGIFADATTTLAEAQSAKYERICRKLELKPGDHVLEIGGGWGGFAEYAARHYGCRITTTTISRRQFEYAQARLTRAGLADRTHVISQDYRELSGRYDKLVSIEMLEAVGHDYFRRYFEICGELLKPGGSFLLQSITIPEHRFARHRHSVDFMNRYIFPGGCLPSIGAICTAVAATTNLQLTHMEDFGFDYARTLSCWHERFDGQEAAIRRLGLDEQFLRMWRYYLSYCEAAFLEQQTGVAQLLFTRPRYG